MKVALLRKGWASYGVIATNAGSMMGTTLVTSGLGFLYWWSAARFFSAEAVGLASTAVSAMTLLGAIGVMGLGTLLVGEVNRREGAAGSLISASVSIAFVVAGLLAGGFMLLAPFLAEELAQFSQGWWGGLLFVLGSAATAVTLVVDQAVIGLLRGQLQLWRNTVFAAVKLLAVWVFAVWATEATGLTIFATWVLGVVASLVVLYGLTIGRRVPPAAVFWPDWGVVRQLRRTAMAHHVLNLALQAPPLILPIVVTAVLSAEITASFFIAWMIANFAFVIPSHLSTVLYAVGSKEPEKLREKLRLTLSWSIVCGLLANAALLVGGGFVLQLFGANYAEQAALCLRLVALGVFPLTIRTHYIALRRIENRLRWTVVLMLAGGTVEVVLAGVGASMGGLTGLAVGWLVALLLETAVMAPAVYRAATSHALPWPKD